MTYEKASPEMEALVHLQMLAEHRVAAEDGGGSCVEAIIATSLMVGIELALYEPEAMRALVEEETRRMDAAGMKSSHTHAEGARATVATMRRIAEEIRRQEKAASN